MRAQVTRARAGLNVYIAFLSTDIVENIKRLHFFRVPSVLEIVNSAS